MQMYYGHIFNSHYDSLELITHGGILQCVLICSVITALYNHTFLRVQSLNIIKAFPLNQYTQTSNSIIGAYRQE